MTDEAAHSGRFSLKWDLSKVADPEATGRDPRWLVVNVGFDPETVKSLRGKRVKVGYWMRLGGGQTVPGLGLRQTLKEGPGEGFYYRGGVTDPAAWNHFETEGRLSPDLESMDIHTWCTVPEAELARTSFFYIDDISLQVIEEPPLSISTPLDEYYIGEKVHWKLSAAPGIGPVKIQFLMGNRVISEQSAKPEAGLIEGEFETARLKPGICILRATGEFRAEAQQIAQQQIILAPNPFDWPALCPMKNFRTAPKPSILKTRPVSALMGILMAGRITGFALSVRGAPLPESVIVRGTQAGMNDPNLMADAELRVAGHAGVHVRNALPSGRRPTRCPTTTPGVMIGHSSIVASKFQMLCLPIEVLFSPSRPQMPFEKFSQLPNNPLGRYLREKRPRLEKLYPGGENNLAMAIYFLHPELVRTTRRVRLEGWAKDDNGEEAPVVKDAVDGNLLFITEADGNAGSTEWFDAIAQSAK